MIVPARLKELMELRGFSQSELGRRVGVSQATIYKLLVGESFGTRHLHKIARELLTTPAYLTGEIDDPDEGAPLPPPAPRFQAISLQVLLPGEEALAEMFEALLTGIDELPTAEKARHLARRLPSGLSQLRDLLPVAATPADARSRPSSPTPVPSPQ